MSEATKLFNQNGGASNGNKQDVVNSAAQVRRPPHSLSSSPSGSADSPTAVDPPPSPARRP